MRKPPQRPGITRISENTETRETVRTFTPEVQQEQAGKFCAGCDKWAPYLKQAKICHPCSDRLKALYGIDSES